MPIIYKMAFLGMPRAKELSDREKGAINALRAAGLGYGRIAKQLHRTKACIRKFLKRESQNVVKKRSGRPKKLTDRDRRRLVAAASNSLKSSKEIAAEVGVTVHPRTVRRALKASSKIVRQRLKTAPKLNCRHKAQRLEFARREMTRNWKKVYFQL